ncbi:Transporter of the ATP-binding cassette (ABC) [Polyrhizophydium stewartii]|uniref:Transporter of the ATP-binding cassette (ABC) n=1 Tax=Polyrhizophydium stewartii TaxID=2732419 RepID=A0ABR4ND10_9FUNG|nr:hypothetical protein HK105_001410 [Polyrhizophydium stewartii]
MLSAHLLLLYRAAADLAATWPAVLLDMRTGPHAAAALLAAAIALAAGFFSDSGAVALNRMASRENGASVFSRLFFFWLNDLITLGSRRPLEQADLWELVPGDTTDALMEQYNAVRAARPTRSLLRNILAVTYLHILFQAVCALLSSILGFAGPFFLFMIVTHIQDPSNGPASGAWVHLVGLFVASAAKTIIDGQMYFAGRRVGTRFRSILVAELYTKSLRRAQGVSTQTIGSDSDSIKAEGDNDDDDSQASLGKIVTLMSVDTERIRLFVSYSHQILIEEPLSVILALAGLFSVLGWSAAAGIAMILIISPLATRLGKAIGRLQDTMMTATDKRISIINEMLQGIRIVKYFAWESYFAAKVAEARAAELRALFNLWGAWIGFGNIGTGSGIVVAFVTFAVFTLVEGKNLDVATAFTAVNLLRVVSMLLSYLPNEIMQVFKAKVSFDRISGFLQEPELEKYTRVVSPEGETSESISDSDTFDEYGPLIGFRNAHFSYFGDGVVPKLSGAAAPPKPGPASETTPLLAPSDSADESGPGPSFVLRNLDIEFPVGSLSVVSGSTGSGKSSLILALLGEMRRMAGRNYLPESRNAEYDPVSGLSSGVAYAAQTAWLLNATIRDNILFGQPFDAQRYRNVIVACALVKDFETLDGGDLTEIGEKGINMSGGQKQRIALARACYSPASFVLLDDPLSAVDAPTARHLLKHCILGAMKGRTVVLVTHAVNLVLPHADYAVVVKNGEILCQGTPYDLVQNVDAEGLFGIDLTIDELGDEADQAEAAEKLAATIAAAEAVIAASEQGNGRRLVEDEEKATGSVRLAVYNSYFEAVSGVRYTIAFMLTFLLVSVASFADDWWLKSWTDHNSDVAQAMPANLTQASVHLAASASGTFDEVDLGAQYAALSLQSLQAASQFVAVLPQRGLGVLASDNSSAGAPEGGNPISQSEAIYYVGIYALFGLGVMIANNIQLITTLWGSFVASRHLHDRLLNAVLRSPLRFFEVTPIGRILNRFSKDIETIDSEVMDSIKYFVQKVIQGITIVCVIGAVTPPFLVVVLPVVLLYLWIARLYLTTSRELKRLESVSRSPIYTQFSETLAGVSTLRAFGQLDRFQAMNNDKVDLNHRSFFFIWAANRWLCLRTELISSVVVLCAGLAIILGGIGAGWAALTITYALDFTNALLWTVRMHADMEMSMNSVERVQEYTSIEQEAAEIVESNRPAPEWPEQGRITVQNLSMRYAPDQPDVLKNVSFEIQSAEKVAVVGRTGAGKSTLSLAFFRIIPASSGMIVIDGVDINTIGLRDLRSRLTIIPQDPVLFTGTLRSNLDPLGEHDDAALWAALKRVHFLESLQQPQAQATQTPSPLLIEFEDSSTAFSSVAPSAVTLDYAVSENGGNFSQGQRQLLCLARALLRRTRVILLDEATASVDNETDAKIQQTIRQEFVEGSVITIAHRLRTIIDYDKVLVLDKGSVLEFGSPLDLIEKSPVAAFRRMCEETGEFEELVAMARDAAVARSRAR